MKKHIIIIVALCAMTSAAKADLVVDSLGVARMEQAVINNLSVDSLSLCGDVFQMEGESFYTPRTSFTFSNGFRVKDYTGATEYFDNRCRQFAFSVGSNRPTAYFYSGANNPAITAEGEYANVPLFIGSNKNSSGTYTSMIKSDGTFISQIGYVTASDRELKDDIKVISNSLESLKEVRPVSYYLKEEMTSTGTARQSAKSENTDNQEVRRKYGFIAQEIEEIFPNVVYTMPDGDKGIAYQEIIPILVSAIQEQQTTIDNLVAEVETLKNPATQQRQQAPAALQEAIADGSAALMQNTPNPFNQATEIAYRLPEGTATAMIMLCDMNGKMLQTYPLAVNTTAGTLTIQAGSYSPGMYLYTLLIDGVQIDTKQMIILAH